MSDESSNSRLRPLPKHLTGGLNPAEAGEQRTSDAPDYDARHDEVRYAPVAPIASRESPVMTLISAALFLYVGFGLGLVGISDSALYNGSVAALTWGARGVGIALLALAALSYVRSSWIDLLDVAVSALAAGGCLVIGAIWIYHGDMQGVLLLLFGAINGAALRSAWQRWSTPHHSGAHR